MIEKDSEMMEEVRRGSILTKFFGRGQQDTTLLTFKGVIKLVMNLPGVNAKLMREKFVDILQRYFAGDPTLVAELRDNYQSENPVNAMARESAGVAEPEAGESREIAFDGMVERVITDARLRSTIADATKEEVALIKSEFDRQRKRLLYDNRAEEKRKDSAHKRRVIEAEVEKNAQLEAEQAKQKTFRVEVDCLKEKLELVKQLKAVEAGPAVVAAPPAQVAPPPPPVVEPEPEPVEPVYNGIVSVSRVADWVLPIDTLDDGFRRSLLIRAGTLAAKAMKPMPNEIIGLFGYTEKWYDAKNFKTMEAIIKRVYREQQEKLRVTRAVMVGDGGSA